MNTAPRHWTNMLLFLLIGMVSIGIPMIPMGLAANSIPFPDLLYVVIVAWIIRRPDSAPMLLVAFLALLGDALLMRPLGLWAVLLLAGSEALRASKRAFRDIPFVLEWAYVAGLFVVLNVLQNLLLLVTFTPMHGFGAVFGHVLRTVAIYPLVVAFLHWGLRIRAPRRDTRPNRVGVVL